MKKITLSILALTCAGFSFSQSTKPLKAPDRSMMIDAPYQAKSIVAAGQPAQPQMSYQQGAKSTNSITFVPLGSAGNILTVLNGQCNTVAASDALSTVVFIHRNDASIFPLTIAQYRYDISQNEGTSFENNIGPLNPSADNLTGGICSRYPQVALYNPNGNTVQDSVWGVYLGSWHDNTSTAASIWNGINIGVFKLDGDSTTWTDAHPTTNNGNVTIATSLCNGLPGEFWAVNFEEMGGADSNLIMYKGIWNPTTRDVDWNIDTLLPFPLTFDGAATFHIDPVIAFDPTGMNGWVGTSADVIPNTNQVYEPIFFHTTDGGVTWNGPIYLDLTTFPNLMATMDPGGSGIPTTAFDCDIVVDMNGHPHYGVVAGSGVGHSIESGLPLNLWDFSYNGSSWTATIVDSVQTFRGLVANGTAGAYNTDNRPQMSISPSGDKVFFMWSDSDPLLTGGDNSLPELFGKGLNVSNGMWSPTIDFTLNDLVWDPHLSGYPNYYPCAAPSSFRNSAGTATLVPVVVMRLNASLSADDPATFYYFNNIQFDDALFVGIPETPAAPNTIQVFPSPASDAITVYYNGLENANATVTITDAVGKTIKQLGNTFNGFERYDLNGLDAGIYFISIKTKSQVITQRFQIAK
jgi:Secretion system C-terminal sorting domain